MHIICLVSAAAIMTFIWDCFRDVFATIFVFILLAFVLVPYCAQLVSSLSMVSGSCCLLSNGMIVSSLYLMVVILRPLMFIPCVSFSVHITSY